MGQHVLPWTGPPKREFESTKPISASLGLSSTISQVFEERKKKNQYVGGAGIQADRNMNFHFFLIKI